ncbi:hypothetical protein P8625_08640 [Tenacibaculum tangerinum]|uniref:DUF4825 domain-containing protein n=1 Tax=Tenacibaculum tangerinum TaxID=3038772 RepID=A0ABY8L1W5_9FLAO|nr:hypothetical protein [Tenacibaculum tangerinum]WGH74188.1 hypothetical protein P8625_08640 [Tenacibaculum tangerinum]
MKNTIKIIFFATIIVAIASCKSNNYSFLDEYPTKAVPLVDSTNFSNHVEDKLLTKSQQELLKLPAIFEGQLPEENAKIGVSYLPKISDNFKSVVYYFYPNNTELISMLVNYDDSFTVINSQVLAYDEIADGMLKTTSTLNKNSIELVEYVSDSPSTIIFSILEDGNITRD